MKLMVLGASGWIGSTIVAEAIARGDEVTALVRDQDNYQVDGVTAKTFDLNDNGVNISSLVSDETVCVAAIGGRALGNHEIVAQTATRLLSELSNSSIQRLLWVGGAGSLEVTNGMKLIESPDFPAEYKDEAIAQGQALEVFRSTKNSSNLDWTFISPAAEIFPGDKSGKYRIGYEQLIMDEQGNSRISVEDYAVAFVDEIENANNINKRIGVAY
ncbi:MAG: NAD(P)H-binding protein [Alteromonadaceae bacterium]|nr:NAD(P)H-binding protein [Alteromonadaceae bacterium]